MRGFRPMLLTLPLLALLCATARAEIRDNGRVFSADTISKAKATIADIEKHHHRRVVVETFAEIPSDKLAAYDLAGKDKAARTKFFRDWLRERAKADGATGVFILICKKPGFVEVEADEATRKQGFSVNDTKELGAQLRADFEQNKFDEGLLGGLDFIDSTMKAHLNIKTQPEVAKPAAIPQVKTNHGGGGGGMSMWGMVCIIGGIVLAFWVVAALIRAFSNMSRGGVGGMGGGQPGGGYMGGPGYVGGGGGGFMSTFMGGMFGSMAGNWMYNSFFGGGHSSGMHYDNPSYGGDAGMGGTGGDGNFDGSASGGGDFGSDDAGTGGGGFFGGGSDDAGGGGGFFGGGDAGGDFGGGGGDFGGGGDSGGDF